MKRWASYLLTFLLLPLGVQAGVQAVWSVNDSEKIDRDDLSHPAKSSNSTWDGKTIRLFGARNEIVAFQVIVESDAGGIRSLSARLPELLAREGKAKIVYAAPEADPSLYAGRAIQLFSENYMQVTKPTAAAWIFRLGTPSAPAKPEGWKAGSRSPLPLPKTRRSGWKFIWAATCRRGSTRGRWS
jgi:hypothetical protein